MGGFSWDGETYTESSGGGDFIDGELFNKLVYTDATCYVTGIREGVSNFDPKKGPQPQWLVDFVTDVPFLDADSEYTKGWAKGNDERDARMLRLQNTLTAAPDDPIPVSFIKVGKRFDVAAPKGDVG